ncbi:MAG TPA: dihydroorotase [bacterium]|nr:dihydroorotase [bacterium]
MKLLIKGGRVIDPSQGLAEPRDVLVEKGRVADLLPPGKKAGDAKVVDARGCWVVPGLIDMHVHLREPGQEYKETIATGAAAAIAGGITAVACMANTNPVNDNASVTDYILEKAGEAGKARVYPVGAVTAHLKGEGLAELGELKDHGCVAASDDGRPVMNAELFRRALEYCLALDIPVLDHAENLDLSSGGCMNEGIISTELGLTGIPAAAEETMVARDVILAELTGARLHVQHVSAAGSVRIIREAKARGVKVTAETCPHYFTLTHEAVRGYDTSFKMNPPLRSRADLLAVIEGIKDGAIDAIASDHAPHSLVEKDLEFSEAQNGIVGLETLLPLSLRLVHDGIITPSRWVEMVSMNPARILAVPGGSLKVGAAADISVIAPDEEWTVDKTRFLSKGRNTPFNGWKVKGKARAVIVEGKVVKV